MTFNIHLSEKESQTLKEVLSSLPGEIEVLVFGSRVNGSHRKFSDLDLCLKGKAEISLSILGDLREKFKDSDLPFQVDLVDYHQITPEFQTLIEQSGVKL